MKQYVNLFHQAGYQLITDVLAVQEQDLLSMGVTLIGHRKKIYKSIAEIKNTVKNGVNGIVPPKPRTLSEKV